MQLIAHIIVYLSVSAALSLAWVVAGDGTVADLRAYVASPATALDRSFWPVWAWLIGATSVVIHAAIALSHSVRPREVEAPSRQLGIDLGRHAADQIRSMVTTATTPPNASEPESTEAVGHRFVVAMFTDIVGSTELNERLGDAAWGERLVAHRKLVRSAAGARNGAEVSTQGDGFFLRFDDPAEAVACAVDIQRRLARQRISDHGVPEIRIGIHVGNALHDDNDVLGSVVNIAARLMSVAGPSEILITEPVADSANDARLEERGLVELKGIRQPRHVVAVDWRPRHRRLLRSVARR